MSPFHETKLLELSAATPEDRARLRRIIDDVSRLEKLGALRGVLIGVLAFLSAPLWVRATFPHVMPAAARFFIAAWVPALVLFAVVSVTASLTRRRVEQRANCTTTPSPDLHSATRPHP